VLEALGSCCRHIEILITGLKKVRIVNNWCCNALCRVCVVTLLALQHQSWPHSTHLPLYDLHTAHKSAQFCCSQHSINWRPFQQQAVQLLKTRRDSSAVHLLAPASGPNILVLINVIMSISVF